MALATSMADSFPEEENGTRVEISVRKYFAISPPKMA